MRSFHRISIAGVLALWGGVLLTIYFTGRVSAYLHPNFQPLVLIAGVLLVGFACLVLIGPPVTTAHGGMRSWIMALILVAPLLLAFANTQDGFGATAVANRLYVQDLFQIPGARVPASGPFGPVEPPLPGETSAAPEEDLYAMPRNNQGQVEAQVVDFLYAAQLPDVREQLDKQPVEVIGQLMPAKSHNPNGDRCVIVRMMMTCCAADAQPIALTIEPARMPDLPEMTWVKVTGTASFPVESGVRRPVILGAVLEAIDSPDDPFLY